MRKVIVTSLLLFLSINAIADNVQGDIDKAITAYNNKEYHAALTLFKKHAESGHTNAQYNLGMMYYEGKGVQQDYKEALTWYRKAAEQGNENAQANLGVMYFNGHGVPRDDNKALKWFHKAI